MENDRAPRSGVAGHGRGRTSESEDGVVHIHEVSASFSKCLFVGRCGAANL